MPLSSISTISVSWYHGTALASVCVLAGLGALVLQDDQLNGQYAVRVEQITGLHAIVRHLFSEREWQVHRRYKKGKHLLVRVRDGVIREMAPLSVRFLSGDEVRACRITALYLVPKGKKPRAQWARRIAHGMKRVCDYWQRQLCGVVDIRLEGRPKCVAGTKTEIGYRESDNGFWGSVVADARRDVRLRSVPEGVWQVIVVFVEAQQQNGGGSAASFGRDLGVALISGEVLPFLFLGGENHPEKVDDPLGRGRVPWDWGLGAIAHEFGHTIGFPHPSPVDGSMMGGGWIRGLRQATLNRRQKRLVLEPAENAGYLTRWQLSGPHAGSSLPRALPRKARWRQVTSLGPRIDLLSAIGDRQHVHAFARTWIRSRREESGALLVGSDDTVAVWVNGALLHDSTEHRGWVPDQDRIPVRLTSGWNEVVIACGNGVGDWAFSVRLALQAKSRGYEVRSVPPPKR